MVRPVPLPRSRRVVAAVASIAVAAPVLGGAVALAAPATADVAERTVALVGDLQDELGCGGDWDPACDATELAPVGDGTYSAEFDVPAGTYEYKVALDDAWDEAYGRDGGDDGAPLVLGGDTRLRVTYDDATHLTALTPLDLAGEYDGATDDALVAAPARQAGGDEQFYFVMTDRFANGDTSNDTAGLGDDPLVSGFDPTNKGFYQGGDLAGLHANLDYIEGLGTTAIWLTPSFMNRPVQGTGDDVSAGYHGYWITDFTQIDPHLGTNAELEALIDDAHARGIKVYFDIITNHTADVIDYTEGEYSYIDQATSPYTDAAGNTFDPADHAGTGDFPELDAATSFPYTPVVADEDADVKVPSWLNDPTLYHNRGNSTWSGESVTYGDFDGLDDLMTEHPTVVSGFVEVYSDWVDLGIDGFRIDTVKHVNREFWDTWTTEVLDYAHAQGKDEFFMFGEVYDADARLLSPYVRETDMSSVLDFAFQASATSYASGNSAQGLAGLFASDDRYTTPDTSAAALPTFLGNHDMGRVGYMLAGTDDALARDELAHELMYLTRGQPVVYYGDEQGFAGTGGDKDARQTLFATQVDSYADQELVTGETAGSQDRYDTDAPLYQHIAELSALRASTPALGSGAQIERYAADGAGIYAISRVDRDEKVEHLVALNNASQERTATFTTLTPGATYSVLYGDDGGTPVVADAGGEVTLTVPATSAVVLVADRTVGVETDGSIAVEAPSAGAAVSGDAPVRAAIDDAWAETSFAWREVGTTDWQPLGTAEDTTPRVFHTTAGLPEGTLVEYRAVTVDADGDRAAASTFASVGVDVSGVPGEEEPETDIDMVTVPGSHNSEMGCAGDWTPDCENARLVERADGVYSGTFDLPAGDHEYKVAINGSWDLNYGAGGVEGGPNATYSHDGGEITFFWDPVSKDFSSTAQGPIITLPGSHQEEVGCPGDWQPDCLATWAKDPDGDGTYTWSTDALPGGAYEAKVAHGMTWAENYGVGGAPDGANYSFSVGEGETVTFSYDLATHELTVGTENPPLAGLGQQAAHWVRSDLLLAPGDLGSGDGWTLWTAPSGGLEVGSVDGVDQVTGPDGGDLPDGAASYLLEPGGAVPDDVAADFPALADHVTLVATSDGEALDRATVEGLLTGQLLVTRSDGDTLTAATGVQVPGVLDDLYAEDAADRPLGATVHPNRKWASFALWAPTAQDVDLLVWPEGRDLADDPDRFDTARADDGTWLLDGKTTDKKYPWYGARYQYAVHVYVPSSGTVETNVVTDPYSVALTTDSTHSVVVDLDDRRYQPLLWRYAKQPQVRPVDQTIYELHVRDFSVSDETVPARLRGTYGAFGAFWSDGMKHLRSLERAGLTTVHLLPTFDIATIPEDPADQETTGDLSGFASDSTEQQAAVAEIQGSDAFNWGYDPLHFQAPEGSYAVHREGGARVAEFRSMVGWLHATGLQVVLDQVFNHTAASGQDAKSVLDRVVPGYYHRLNPTTGAVETSTCCQNVATEHAMAEKLMVDSVVTWARDYKVDGFRFDLMGHHSRDTMLAVREALDGLTPHKDGVDGSAVYLYGEGWNFGEVADNALFTQATQGQLGGTGIGTFSDRLRDAVHGGSPVDGASTFTQGFGTGLFTDPNGREARTGEPGTVNDGGADEAADLGHQTDLVRLGLAGNLRDFTFTTSDGETTRGEDLDYRGSPAGYADSPEEVVTYVDAHDNETLFDLLTLKLPQATSMDDRVRMNTVSLATAALAQTPSFWHAGTDLLRSKSLDRNSYDSGDWFNAIDWSGQDNGFGRGLPMAADNEDKWPVMAPLLADPALKPTPDHIGAASDRAAELLELRSSTRLFRLGSAEAINAKVSFPGSGPDAAPGVIVMAVDDRVGADADRRLDGLVTVFNASPEAVTVDVPGWARRDLRLSPVQAGGGDAVVKQTRWDRRDGTVTVPARTVAVLVEPTR